MGTLTILNPGMQTLLVDAGRVRTRSLGVPVGGAADRFSLAIGNALVGNPPETTALECCLVGPTLRADVPLACVVWGAPFVLATNKRVLRSGTTFTLEPGELLRIGGSSRGMRAYLCIAGGIAAPQLLYSRSSLSPLTSDTLLTVREGRTTTRRADLEFNLSRRLRVLPGPQADWFDDPRLGQYEVTPASNRMGLRLRGAPLKVPSRELVSEPVCPGVIQVTREGQCIILGVDGQTIGGYPKIAQVIAADLDLIGQLRPGDSVEFEYVTLQEAEGLWRERQKRLRQWTTRLRLSAGALG